MLCTKKLKNKESQYYILKAVFHRHFYESNEEEDYEVQTKQGITDLANGHMRKRSRQTYEKERDRSNAEYCDGHGECQQCSRIGS